MFCKKGVLRNFAEFTEKNLCQSLYFNKVAGQACNFIKIETLAQVFSCKFCEILRTAFFQNTSGRVLLIIPAEFNYCLRNSPCLNSSFIQLMLNIVKSRVQGRPRIISLADAPNHEKVLLIEQGLTWLKRILLFFKKVTFFNLSPIQIINAGNLDSITRHSISSGLWGIFIFQSVFAIT